MKWFPLKANCLSSDFRFALITIFASVVAGATAGAMAGWTVVDFPVSTYVPASVATSSASSTSLLGPDVTLVNVDPESPELIVPPAFTERRTSPAATVYRMTSKTASIYRDADAVAQAVAVTSDGWYVVPLETVKSIPVAELVIWQDGPHAVSRGVADARGSVAFLKTDIHSGSAPSFARFQDVSRGMAVWVERRPGNFESMIITALGRDTDQMRGVSSDLASRRGSLSGTLRAGDIGSPVWGTNGSLIGLMEGLSDGRARFIPSSAWAPSLFGIFSDGTILHATLGVHVIDLANTRLVEPGKLPTRGALIIGNAEEDASGIAADSPASQAGLKDGDVIQLVDRDILDGRADLGEILVQYKPNASVKLTVLRDGATMEVPVTLGSKVMSSVMK
jgi:S1-C subfamily serine protease